MKYRMRLAVMAFAALLAACGDGDGPRTTAVRVAGDSLNDSGTFGFKFTVQDSINGTQIWVDHVAEAVGVDAPCARHVAMSEYSVVENPGAVDCTSYAVGRARINVWDVDPVLVDRDDGPFSIAHQLERMSQAKAFGPEELLLVNGGGNDVADLLRAYLAGSTSFGGLLAELPPPNPLPQSPFNAEPGAVYMTALADKLTDDLISYALKPGVQRVVVLNIPALTQTPYLKAIKEVLKQKFGGGDDGAAAAAGVIAMVDQWVQAFNSRLQTRLDGDSRIVLVDLYTPFSEWVARPADFGFTDSSSIACPPETAVQPDAFGLPAYVLGNCQAWRLSAYPPAGATGPNWWTTYVFSDDFHGSPMTNRLMADLVLHKLRERGWL
jgi:outer membrane lipase/esterase